MRFEHEVLIWPRNDLERELPSAYLEGTLRIIVGDTRFFEDIGILLCSPCGRRQSSNLSPGTLS